MIQETAPEPGKKQALALSVGMHLLLLLGLFFGVQWKTEHAAVEVELWSSVPRPATSLPPPATQSKREASKPAPEPVEKKPQAEKKADIVVKDEKKPRQEAPKPDPIKDMRKQLEQEERQRQQIAQANERANREAELRALAEAEQQAAGRKNAENAWAGKIRDKVRGNIVLPPNVQGNPEAVFEINLLPDGTVIGQPRLARSSGAPALDAAIERAILKSSPLPKPDDPAVFRRNLQITYRPYE
jgi:colicin import membrane protein